MLVFGGVHPGEKLCNDGFTQVIRDHKGKIRVTNEHCFVQLIGNYLVAEGLSIDRQKMSKLLDATDATIGSVVCFIQIGDAWYACLKCLDDTETKNRSFSLSHTENEIIELGIVDDPKRPGCEILFVTKSYKDMLDFIVKKMSIITIPEQTRTDEPEFSLDFIDKLSKVITSANKEVFDLTTERNKLHKLETKFHQLATCHGGKVGISDLPAGLKALAANIETFCLSKTDNNKTKEEPPVEGKDRKRVRTDYDW